MSGASLMEAEEESEVGYGRREGLKDLNIDSDWGE